MCKIMSQSMDVPNESQSNNNTKDPQVSVQLEGEKNPIKYQISEHLIAFGLKEMRQSGILELLKV